MPRNNTTTAGGCSSPVSSPSLAKRVTFLCFIATVICMMAMQGNLFEVSTHAEKERTKEKPVDNSDDPLQSTKHSSDDETSGKAMASFAQGLGETYGRRRIPREKLFQPYRPDCGVLVETPKRANESSSLLCHLLLRGRYNDSLHWPIVFPPAFAPSEGLSHQQGWEKLATGGSPERLANGGNRISLLRVFNNMKMCLNEGMEEDESVVPLWGLPLTNIDFQLAFGLLSTLDVGVQRFHFIINGQFTFPSIFVDALQMLFGAHRIIVTKYRQNQGVSGAWNTAFRLGFQQFDPPVRYVVVSNADVLPFPTLLPGFVKDTWHASRTKVVNRFAHFALFALTSFGYQELGLFDETIFPAYGEDVEFHVRAVSKGLGKEDKFGKYGSNDADKVYFHFHSPNKRADGGISRMVASFNHPRYIQVKWGINTANTVDFQKSTPYKFPFNDEELQHNNSWRIDPNQRQCVMTWRKSCPYDTSVLAALKVPTSTKPSMKSAFSDLDESGRKPTASRRRIDYADDLPGNMQ